VGAAIGQTSVPLIQRKFGWKAVFYFLIALCIVTNLTISKLFIIESKELCQNLFKRFKKNKDDNKN
jgi:sugar phosphate permease